ncbi:hypothetical protein [Nonomuraea dietziae]|uniref:hypothetical protein n=1 Tax=Nonomuraea dietziae TaxID=65515 RepID=UPI0031D5D403
MALFTNFAQAWESANLQESLASTALYSVVSPALGVLIGAMAGYTIVVLRLRYGLLVVHAAVRRHDLPSQMLLVPLFVVFSDVGPVRLQGRHDPRLLPRSSVPLSAFVLRNFFTGVAFSIFERPGWTAPPPSASSGASTCRWPPARWRRSSSSISPSSGTTCSSA